MRGLGERRNAAGAWRGLLHLKANFAHYTNSKYNLDEKGGKIKVKEKKKGCRNTIKSQNK